MPFRDDLRESGRLQKANFSVPHGVRAAIVVVAPIVIGLAIGHLELVYTTLGALLLTNTEGPNSSTLPLRFLLLGCVTEPLGFAVGTMVALTGLAAVPLVGVGVFIGLLSGESLAVAQVGRFTAIFFAVGVGLPGASSGVVFERLWLSMLGAALAFAGALVHSLVTSRRPSPEATATFWRLTQQRTGLKQLWPTTISLQSQVLQGAAGAGVASMVGLAIGLALNLPRDFWIVVTIITAIRPRIGPTAALSLIIVLGTVAGAAMAAAITIGTGNVYALDALLFLFAVAMFSTRGVNLGLTQVSFTPFVIILLNLLYPGQWQLAEARILDVAIGGALAIVTVYFLRAWTELPTYIERPAREG